MTIDELTVGTLFRASGLVPARPVQWGEEPASRRPGVYVIASTSEIDDPDGASSPALSPLAIAELMTARHELAVDCQLATEGSLRGRLEQMWVPGSPVLYIGLAGTSLRTRVGQYYRTAIGARHPHAGGWPLKMLDGLSTTWVHCAETPNSDQAERSMISRFMDLSVVRIGRDFCDPATPLPFANLTVPRGRRQRHGISGARAPKPGNRNSSGVEGRAPDLTAAHAAATASIAPREQAGRTQRITAVDMKNGQIRVPKASKSLFPDGRGALSVNLRGRDVVASWDPRTGPDRSRSGLIRVGRATLESLVSENEILWILTTPDGYTIGEG